MIIIVLPAFNEADAIKHLLGSLIHILGEHFPISHTVIVDDGSTDNTAETIKSYQGMPIELIEHGHNKGLGEAVKTGLLSALRIAKDDDIIITMDADNTHNPGLITRMAMCIEEGNDVVIASRYVPGSRVLGLSAYRQVCSFGASLLLRILFPIPGVRDYTCGYRAYHAGKLKQAFQLWGDSFISMSGFSCVVDVLLKLRELNSIMTEVPMILRYDLKPGKSKMDVRKTIKEILCLVLRRKFNCFFKYFSFNRPKDNAGT